MLRVLEPELMEDEAQALAYAKADFDAPNAAFIDALLARFPELPEALRAVDLGCGPADIPRRLLARLPGWRFDAVDGSAAMLAAGSQRHGAPADRLRLHVARVPDTGLPAASYGLILSNSLLHHLPDPQALWSAVAELGAPGAAVLIGDLFRPDTPEMAQETVDRWSSGEPEVLRLDFFNSLCAAFSPDEVRAQLHAAGLPLTVEVVSDRHLLVFGRLPGATS
jgi:trans-aconitate methyltransferase